MIMLYKEDWTYRGGLKFGVPHGEGMKKYKDESEEYGYYRKGQRHGSFRTQKYACVYKEVGQYVNDKKHGLIEHIYKDKRYFSCFYKHGERHGLCVYKSEEKYVKTLNYRDGIIHGNWREEFPDGGYREYKYKNGVRHGKSKCIDGKGILVMGIYKDGVKAGVFTTLDRRGRKIKQEWYYDEDTSETNK